MVAHYFTSPGWLISGGNVIYKQKQLLAKDQVKKSVRYLFLEIHILR